MGIGPRPVPPTECLRGPHRAIIEEQLGAGTYDQNFALEKNTLENSFEDLLINADDSGITAFISGTCIGISDTKEGKLKATVTGEGLREV